MKAQIFTFFLFLTTYILSSQNIGINNTDPNVSLDVTGALAHRSVVVQPFLNNVNVPINVSFLVIGNENVDGIVNIVDPEIWIDGRRMVIFNSTGFNATFNGNTILPNKSKEFICKSPTGGWQVISGNDESGTNTWSTMGNAGTDPGTHFLGTNDVKDFVVKTNGKERLRLDKDKASLKFSGELLDTNRIIMSSANILGSVDFSTASYLNSLPSLNFSVKGSGEYSYFNKEDILNLGSDGFVGIGTHIGNGKLTINHRALGQSLPSISIIDSSLNNTSGGILQFSNIFGTPTLNLHGLIGNNPTGGDSYFLFSRGGNYLMQLRGDGNLGIGVADPTSKLDVDGNMAIRGLNLFEFGKGLVGKEVNAGKIGYNAFGQNALTFVGGGTSTTNRRVFFYAEGGASFNGNIEALSSITVGTTSLPPGYKMSVDGKIIAEELRIQNSNAWPDYVFEQDYPLMTLEETEKQIEVLKHLPLVPSAQDVKENGIIVGEMQKILLKKIEELTLHLIAQNKAIKALQDQLKK